MKKNVIFWFLLFLAVGSFSFASAESYVQRVSGSCASNSSQTWERGGQSSSYSVNFDYARENNSDVDSLFLGIGNFDGWLIVDGKNEKTRNFPYTQDCSGGCPEDATYDSSTGWSDGVYHGWDGFLDYGCIDQICNYYVEDFQEKVADSIICDCNKTTYQYNGSFYNDGTTDCGANITYTEVWNGTPVVQEGVVCAPCPKICKEENMLDEINVSFDRHKITLKKERDYVYEYDGLDDNPKFVNSVSLSFIFDALNPKTIFTVLKRFGDEVPETGEESSLPRLLQYFLKGHPLDGGLYVLKENVGWDSEKSEYKLSDDHTSTIIFLDDPCPEKILIIQEGEGDEKVEVPISPEVISSKDFDKLVGDTKKWVYAEIEGVSKCMAIVSKKIDDTIKEYNSAKIASTLNKGLNVAPEEITIPGNKESDEVIPIIIGNPGKGVASVFESKEFCERWSIWNSWSLFWEGEYIPISGLILSEEDVSKGEAWVAVRKPGEESSCEKVVKQETPSVFSCGAKTKDPFDLDITPIVPDVQLPTTVPPEACEGFEIVSGALSEEQKERHKEILKEEEEYGQDFVDRYNKAINNLKIVAAKTYDTKEKCEKGGIYVNWYPGMNLVDGWESDKLKKFVNAHIGDSGYSGGTKGMRDKLPEEEYYEFLTDKDIDISFGWSSGALERGDKNAVNSLKLTYSKKKDVIKKLGLFLFDPTGWDETHAGSFDNIPVDKFPTGIVLLSKRDSLWKKSGDPRLIEIDLLNDYDIDVPGVMWALFIIPIPNRHFGVSNILIKEIFKIYVDGLADSGTRASIEASIRSLLEANRGYRGGDLKSPISSTDTIAEDQYAEIEEEYTETGKEYAMLELKDFANNDFKEKTSSGELDIQTQLSLVNNYLQYIDFGEMMLKDIPTEEFQDKGFYGGKLYDYDNDSISTLEDETPFG